MEGVRSRGKERLKDGRMFDSQPYLSEPCHVQHLDEALPRPALQAGHMHRRCMRMTQHQWKCLDQEIAHATSQK